MMTDIGKCSKYHNIGTFYNNELRQPGKGKFWKFWDLGGMEGQSPHKGTEGSKAPLSRLG